MVAVPRPSLIWYASLSSSVLRGTVLFVTGRALVLTECSVLSAALALDVQGRIQWTALCPGKTPVALRPVVDRKLPAGPRDLGPAKALLDDGRLNAGITHDGRFLM